jgi:hypothetical protein
METESVQMEGENLVTSMQRKRDSLAHANTSVWEFAENKNIQQILTSKLTQLSPSVNPTEQFF